MDWSKRVVVRLLLISMWTLSLFTLAFPARAQAQGGEGSIHIVAAGETLSQIARQYDTDVASLLELNGLSNANLVYVGQQLVVEEGGYNRSGGEQSRWEEEEPVSEPSYSRQGAGWEPEPSGRPEQSGPYQRAGVAWEPQGSNEGPSQQNNEWQQPQYQPQYEERNATREENSYREETYREETYRQESYQEEGQDSRPSEYSPYLEEWESVHSEQQGSYSPGQSWEPQPQVGRGREAELTGEKWIDVDISDQTLTAYQGDSTVRFFSISSGSSTYPTVTGSFRTYARTELQDMSGGSQAAGNYYFQPDVPWVQYFFEDYAIHGAYWHNRFGTPVGHGCINMRVDESEWLYEWAGTTGIRVEVHQ